jgi:hypothetical protein
MEYSATFENMRSVNGDRIQAPATIRALLSRLAMALTGVE